MKETKDMLRKHCRVFYGLDGHMIDNTKNERDENYKIGSAKNISSQRALEMPVRCFTRLCARYPHYLLTVDTRSN